MIASVKATDEDLKRVGIVREKVIDGIENLVIPHKETGVPIALSNATATKLAEAEGGANNQCVFVKGEIRGGLTLEATVCGKEPVLSLHLQNENEQETFAKRQSNKDKGLAADSASDVDRVIESSATRAGMRVSNTVKRNYEKYNKETAELYKKHMEIGKSYEELYARYQEADKRVKELSDSGTVSTDPELVQANEDRQKLVTEGQALEQSYKDMSNTLAEKTRELIGKLSKANPDSLESERMRTQAMNLVQLKESGIASEDTVKTYLAALTRYPGKREADQITTGLGVLSRVSLVAPALYKKLDSSVVSDVLSSLVDPDDNHKVRQASADKQLTFHNRLQEIQNSAGEVVNSAELTNAIAALGSD